MSLAPYYLRGARFGFTSRQHRRGRLEHGEPAALAALRGLRRSHHGPHGGEPGREVRHLREEQDAFARQSQERAADAIESGRFEDEIVPVEVPAAQGRRRRSSIPTSIRACPAWSSWPSSGLCSKRAGASPPATRWSQRRRRVSRAHVRRRGEEEGPDAAGHRPRPGGRRRRPAHHGDRAGAGLAQGARARRRLSLSDIGLIEVNEAFAAQALAVVKELDLDQDDRQRQRRRDRARASARLLRRPHHDDHALRDAPARHALRARRHLHRRRPGHGLGRRDGPLSRARGLHPPLGSIPKKERQR